MYIKEIVCADKEDSEADVIISDGVYTIKCYMYPVTDVLVNQKINVIYAFECTDIMRVQSIKYEIKKLQGYYAYMIIAKVINSAFCRVQRTPMRFRADAVQSTTDALKQCIFSYSRGFITTV